MHPIIIVAIPLVLLIAGMILNSIGLSFDQPPTSAEQDPAKRAAVEAEGFRRFFDLQRNRAVQRQKRIGQYACLLIVAMIGSFIWLYKYTVSTTTAATQFSTLQTMALEEGKELVLSVMLRRGALPNTVSNPLRPVCWTPPRKKEFQSRRSHRMTWNNQARS